jgi:DNA-binding XRE family transcriptional regulator
MTSMTERYYARIAEAGELKKRNRIRNKKLTPRLEKKYSMASGKQIKMWRVDAGITSTELAKHIGVSYHYWNLIENGQVSPTEETVRKLVSYFHEDFDSLMILSGRIPTEIEQILLKTPHAFAFLRLVDRNKWSLDPAQWRADNRDPEV